VTWPEPIGIEMGDCIGRNFALVGDIVVGIIGAPSL
jgi:hypothetical protein